MEMYTLQGALEGKAIGEAMILQKCRMSNTNKLQNQLFYTLGQCQKQTTDEKCLRMLGII